MSPSPGGGMADTPASKAGAERREGSTPSPGTISCGWPFHHDAECGECKQWEKMYGENLTAWIDQRAEVRAAAKAARRKTMQRGVSAPERPGSG